MADDLDDAYEKIVKLAKENAKPYKAGPEGVDAQWVFEGVTEILPIYEEIGDGCEIMWAEREPRKLKNLRKMVRRKGEFTQ